MITYRFYSCQRYIYLQYYNDFVHFYYCISDQCACWIVLNLTLYVILAGILDKGIQIDGLGMKSFMTYESNVLFVLRFMIDCKIVGGNWIEVPAHKYMISANKFSFSQLEFDCLYPFSINDIANFCYINLSMRICSILPN